MFDDADYYCRPLALLCEKGARTKIRAKKGGQTQLRVSQSWLFACLLGKLLPKYNDVIWTITNIVVARYENIRVFIFDLLYQKLSIL